MAGAVNHHQASTRTLQAAVCGCVHKCLSVCLSACACGSGTFLPAHTEVHYLPTIPAYQASRYLGVCSKYFLPSLQPLPGLQSVTKNLIEPIIGRVCRGKSTGPTMIRRMFLTPAWSQAKTSRERRKNLLSRQAADNLKIKIKTLPTRSARFSELTQVIHPAVSGTVSRKSPYIDRDRE
ncbi:hypothetical protein LZ30DRAFT_436630 [Colletotrichum cereale]|nr:hypothetical protein LZ30DRAFT_436630 [Colletotrichum cereale]